MIKPVGVYGSKSEIIRFFRSLNVVNDDMYVICFFCLESPWIIRLLVLACYLCQLSMVVPGRPYRQVYMS
jgi:hypothetical protein